LATLIAILPETSKNDESRQIGNANVSRIKKNNILEIGQGARPCEATLYRKVEIFDILAGLPPLRRLR